MGEFVNTIILRPAEPERDFGQLAVWFSSLEDEPTSESDLKEYYEEQRRRIIQMVAEDGQGELLGFYWAIRGRLKPDRVYFDLFVKPEQREQGVGRRLYEDLARAVEAAQAKRLRVNVWDTCPECRAFAERRGFTERWHRARAAELNVRQHWDKRGELLFGGVKCQSFM
jgi:GNAT superfamily N-acetyltransferase